MATRKEKETEFFNNVWDHTLDSFQTSFDERRPLTDPELSFICSLGEAVQRMGSPSQMLYILE